MKKYLTSLNLVFATEIIVVVLASLGIIPREAILFLTGLVVFYMIFSPVQDSLWLFLASIPLFVAMPISDSFDSMANWRILIAVLFLCLFFKQGVSLSLKKNQAGKWRLYENLKHGWLEYLALIFLLLAAISIFAAEYRVLAIKKLLFIVSIFLLFLIIQNLTRKGSLEENKKTIVRYLTAAATGGIIVLAVALIQFIAVLFVPLFTFWQYWAHKIISVFYGQNLADLLSYSNSWFAYYASNPPTLRLFSVFPDSHSFAMFCILLVPIFLMLAFLSEKQKRKKIFWWFAAALALFGVVLSGSRGAWLSAVPAIFVLVFIYFKKYEKPVLKNAAISFAVFIALFVISVGYPPMLYTFQSWQGGENASTTFSFFERARSISDIEETSNLGRLEIWSTSLKSVIAHPFLGVGLGNYVTVLDQNISAAKKGASAHNLYLDFASEIGIFGALIMVVLFINIFYTAWLVFRSGLEPHFKAFGFIFGLYFLWVAAYSFFDVVMLNDKVFLLLMVDLAALYSLRRIVSNPYLSKERNN